MKKHYVALDLNNLKQTESKQRKFLWRFWRQLSRFQRNFILCFVLVAIVTYFTLSRFTFYGSVVAIPHDVNADGKLVEELIVKAPNRPQKVRLAKTSLNVRQKAVKKAMLHAWRGYKKYAWGHDNLRPIKKDYHDWFYLGLTIVDSLDTLFLMGLKEEFEEGRKWVAEDLTYDSFADVNLFEVTIRVLGGLLSTYHLTGDKLFLDKATNLGKRLLPCFTKSPTVIPFSDVNLGTGYAHSPHWSPDSSTAEITTVQLEFRDLSRSTGDHRFERAAAAVSEHVHALPKPFGLVPIFINPHNGKFRSGAEIKLGARGDSYYEYLLKQWIQTDRTIEYLKEDYIKAVDGIMEKLVKTTPRRNLTFVGELKPESYEFSPKMDHLVCYLPGTLTLGYYYGMPETHLILAKKLLETCYYMYADMPTFLSPEIVYFNLKRESGKSDMYVHEADAHNLLRPEFVESLWAMYQITGNKTYQHWGWKVFQAIEKYAKVAHGYTSISSVLNPSDTKPKDMMESFFLSETLKYLYLLFSSDREILSFKSFVMNTEGHPLPIYHS